MKTKLLSLLLIASFAMQAQLVLLDEPKGDGSGNVISLTIYDNDIFYTMPKVTASNQYGIFASNGVPGEKIELLPESTSVANFHATIGSSFRRLYGNGNYQAGKNIYAKISNSGTSKVYKFNESRTFLTPENIFQEAKGSDENIFLVANDGLITYNKEKPEFVHFTNKGNMKTYALPSDFKEDTAPGYFFKWKNKLIFSAKLLGEADLYEVDVAVQTTRITQNKASRNSSFKGVSPSNILLGDNYIYFIGRYGYYENVVSGPLKRQYPVMLCYSNGDIDFGKDETAIYNGDDGSLGYKSIDMTDNSPSEILGKIGERIVYYNNRNKKIMSVPNIEDLGIPLPIGGSFKYLQHNDKLYILSRESLAGYADLYITDGTATGTKKTLLPPFTGTSLVPKSVGNIQAVGNKIYFLAEYDVRDRGHMLLSYSPEKPTVSIEYIFPKDVNPVVNFLYPYNNGFILRVQESIWSKEQLYTLNVEHRAKIFKEDSNKNAKKIRSTVFKLNNTEYPVTLVSVVFSKEDDQLKAQLLDTSSTQFKQIIKSKPESDKTRISDVFYAVNSIKSADITSASLSLGYADKMFGNATLTSSNTLSVMAFYNDKWHEIKTFVVDVARKTVSVELNNIPSEAFIFFKVNGVLSNESIAVSDSKNLNVFPNPVTNNVTISTQNKETLQQVQIFNILGKKVLDTSLENESKYTLNISQLTEGVYIMKTKTNRQLYTKKIIKN